MVTTKTTSIIALSLLILSPVVSAAQSSPHVTGYCYRTGTSFIQHDVEFSLSADSEDPTILRGQQKMVIPQPRRQFDIFAVTASVKNSEDGTPRFCEVQAFTQEKGKTLSKLDAGFVAARSVIRPDNSGIDTVCDGPTVVMVYGDKEGKKASDPDLSLYCQLSVEK